MEPEQNRKRAGVKDREKKEKTIDKRGKEM